ncbi:SsrA-binding protein [Rhynchospora pubera]|uniref:SsrA-binding protein n=1 Tax=Rhynchospora pubera TaxID=906938 RepID=A0AAV8C9Z4_9POAL|nr:SsrA-binding protein [Rhynchospora pubera]
MGSWVNTITSPFKRARTIIKSPRDNKETQKGNREDEKRGMALEEEVMACGYEDVRVMWSILDKSKNITKQK